VTQRPRYDPTGDATLVPRQQHGYDSIVVETSTVDPWEYSSHLFSFHEQENYVSSDSAGFQSMVQYIAYNQPAQVPADRIKNKEGLDSVPIADGKWDARSINLLMIQPLSLGSQRCTQKSFYMLPTPNGYLCGNRTTRCRKPEH
jgi:hypothetical protein